MLDAFNAQGGMIGSVLDIDQDGETLVVLTESEERINDIAKGMEQIWTGPVEVYCATTQVFGAFA